MVAPGDAEGPTLGLAAAEAGLPLGPGASIGTTRMAAIVLPSGDQST